MIKWSKNYLMGIDKLDEEHKELFRISDQIYNKVMERGDDAKYRLFLMNETLEYMLRYFKRHAKGEEIYMREIGYAGYEFHKMLHDEFYNMLLKKKADIVKRNECSKKEIVELVGDGIGWLLEHIITEDMAIVGKGISAISSYNSDFEEQLKKCGVDYFDFYLFHNVCEMNIDAYLDPKYGIFDYLMEQKKNGRIRHLGFSAHGNYDVMKRFLDAYGKDMEFCQIQLNFLDWTFQGAKEKVELLKEWNIPVWVMEPLRGGKLAKLAAEDEKALKALRPEESIPAWAFRFLQSVPGVTMVLSGMSNLQQMQDNIHTFAEDKPLTEKEMDTLLQIADGMVKKTVLPCTACHYCTSHCPQSLPIPELLALYNEHCFTEGGFIAPMALSAYPQEKLPSACIGCRSCEAVCPQQIKISEAMADFAQKMGM